MSNASFFQTMKSGVIRANQAKNAVFQQVADVARTVGAPGMTALRGNSNNNNPRIRAMAAKGYQELFGHSNGILGRAKGAASFEDLIAKNPHKAKEINHLNKLATSYGNAALKGKTRIASAKLTKLKKYAGSSGLDLSNIKPKFSSTFKHTAATSIGGNKIYASALLNPTTIGAGLGLTAATKAIQYTIGRDKAWRTENVGSGKFGRDTAGILGTAGTEGLKFQSHKKRGRFF